MKNVRNLVGGGVFVAFGVLLPVVFHMIGGAGPVFLPMHIPVLIAGLFLGPSLGVAVGVVTPVLSHLLTGMPPLLPTLPLMTVELSVYGLAAGALYQRNIPLVFSLAGAIAAGRLAAVLMVALLVHIFHFRLAPLTYIYGAIITGLPGLVIQFALIPLLVRRLEHYYGKRQPETVLAADK